MTEVYAHRGASIEFPENTLAAFRRALEIGCEGIELDIHLSKEGTPVVIHDDSVDRTTNGSGKVNTLTLDELKALDAGNGEQIPTLAEVLELVGGQAHFNLEIKTAEAAEAMLAEVRKWPQVRWAVSCFDWSALVYVREQMPEADVWPASFGSVEGSMRAADWIEGLVEVYPPAIEAAARIRENAMPLDQIIEFAKSVGGSALSIYWEALTPETVAQIHAAGLKAWAWTVNDLDQAQGLIDLGADAICTDNAGPVFALTRAALTRS